MLSINHERDGFDLGWDIARQGYELFDDTRIGACVANGITAGRAHFGRVPILTCRYERKLLQSRISAHRRGIQFAVNTVTANFLKKIDVKYCPITRTRLTHSTGRDSDWSIDRIDNRIGYRPGNIVIMSAVANAEKDALDFRGLAKRAADHTLQLHHAGVLSPEAWQRLWTLSAFTVREADAATWPMVIIPPSRVAMTPDWEIKMFIGGIADFGLPQGRLRALLDGKKELRAVTAFSETKRFANERAVTALVKQHEKSRSELSQWATEDAWREALVNLTYLKLLDALSGRSRRRIAHHFLPPVRGRETGCAESLVA